MEEVETLRSSCLLEAKQLREEMLSSKENGWNNEVCGILIRGNLNQDSRPMFLYSGGPNAQCVCQYHKECILLWDTV